jgi:hypothetical protein
MRFVVCFSFRVSITLSRDTTNRAPANASKNVRAMYYAHRTPSTFMKGFSRALS